MQAKDTFLPVEVWMYDNIMMEGKQMPDVMSKHQMLDDAKKFARIMSKPYSFRTEYNGSEKFCCLIIVEMRYGRISQKPIIIGRDITADLKNKVKAALGFPVAKPKQTAAETLAQSIPKQPEKPAKGRVA